MGNLGVDGVKKWNGEARGGLVWFRVRTNGAILFHKMWGIA